MELTLTSDSEKKVFFGEISYLPTKKPFIQNKFQEIGFYYTERCAWSNAYHKCIYYAD